MISKKHFKYLPVLFLFLFFNNSANSQIRISSPYSYYGLGELQSAHSAFNSGMGGIKTALRNPAYINPGNPASYTSLDTNSFIFDVGVTSNSTQLKSSLTTQNFTNHTSISYLLFGFPVAKWCGLSVGLLPFSKTGYKVVTRDTLPTIGQVNEQFEGTGGINQAYIGTGFRLFKNLSIGVNVGYLFGTIYKNRSVYTPDLPYSYNIRMINDIQVSSFYMNYGLQYQMFLKKKYSLILGGKFNLPMNLTAKRSQIAERFTASGDVESIKDTLLNIASEKGSIHMPLTLGGGITFAKRNNWMFGVDFDWQNWKKFKSFNTLDSINNSFNIAAGGEIIPKYTLTSKYWKKMSYRFGFHYGRTYLELNGNKIDDFSFSVGLGFPVSKLRTMISLSAEAGKKGSIQPGLIQENYVKFTLGFSFREFWFYRPKLN
jgi:long-subunit fatty acid transport protein